ncbi:hypothetical protein [Lactobacillus helveticus]|uniref:hypothetical protein n=1 Tax=Lactobacillus helveticus TaxID=1587 RepID=UPI001A0AD04D|nr:hypothetical protein [Lactobacillus helveticus]NRO92541.1 hypothetical protein [Lactobacillus helveticus]
MQDVDGIVLQDVHGKRVAIGKGFDYESIYEFMRAYFEEYGADDFAKQIGYEDSIEMFKIWLSGNPFYESHSTDWLYESFNGIDSYLLKDPYDHKNEDKLEAEDHKLDQALGK